MKKIFTVLFCLFALVLLSGCSGQKSAEKKDVPAKEVVLRYTPTLEKLGFKDPVRLKGKPEKVVSLVQTPVLALYEMGVTQIGIPESRTIKWPEALDKSAKKFNTTMNSNFDIESVVAMNPDLVIVGYQSKDTYGKTLESQKIPVYYVDAGHVVTYQSVKDLTYALIDAFGENNKNAETIRVNFEKLEKRMADRREKNKNTKIMVLMSAPPRHFIQTRNGTLGNQLELLGYKNVYENDKSPMVLLDKEQAISYDPDILFCVGAAPTGEMHKAQMEEDFKKNPEYWNQIKAIRENRVIYLPSSYIASAGIDIIDRLNGLMDMLDERKL